MIYINGDGMWLRCSCLKNPQRLGNTITIAEIRTLIEKHGHH